MAYKILLFLENLRFLRVFEHPLNSYEIVNFIDKSAVFINRIFIFILFAISYYFLHIILNRNGFRLSFLSRHKTFQWKFSHFAKEKCCHQELLVEAGYAGLPAFGTENQIVLCM